MKNKITAFLMAVCLFMICLPSAVTAAGEIASAKFSSLTPVLTNLTKASPRNSNGLEATTAGGESCVKLKSTGSIYDAVLVDISSTFMRGLTGEGVDINIRYYDEGYGVFFIRYDSKNNSSKETELVKLTNSGTWKTYTFHLYDAYFASRFNGADFELSLYSERTGHQTDKYLIFNSIEIRKTGKKFPVFLTENGPDGNMFVKGETPKISFSANNVSGEALTVPYTVSVTNSYGETVNSSGSVSFAAGASSASVPMGVDKCGVYDAHIVFDDGGEIYREYDTNFSVTVVPRNANNDFGVNTHYRIEDRQPTISLPIAKKLGAGYIRESLFWSQCETTKGTINIPDSIMKAVDEANANNIKVMLSLSGGNKFYDNGNFPTSEDAVAAFGNFVYEAVSRLKGKVDTFGVMNEFHHWSGNGKDFTASDYVKVLKAAYENAKPTSTIIGLSGLPGVWDYWVGDMFEAGAASYMDYFEMHEYDAFQPPETNMMGWIDNVEKQLSNNNASNFKMWIGETGWATSDVSEQEQYAYGIRQYIQYKEKGIDKYFWYDLKNDGLNRNYDQNSFGLIYNHKDIDKVPYSAKPAYAAFANMNDKIGNAEIESHSALSDSTQVYKFVHTDSTPVWVLWNTQSNKTASVSIGEERIEVFDVFGNAQTMESADGTYSVNVGSEPIYITPKGYDMSTGITSINYATGEISARILGINPQKPITVEVVRPNKTKEDIYDLKSGAVCYIAQSNRGSDAYEFTFTADEEGTYTIYANTGDEMIELAAAYYKNIGASVSLWQNGSEIKEFSSLSQTSPITAKAVIDNSNAAWESYMFIIALYKGDRLCKVETDNGEILPTEPQKTPDITITPDSEYDSVSVFIWKNKTRLIPIMDKFNLSKQ